MLHVLPFRILVSVQSHILPVDCEYRSLLGVAKRWHLEREEVKVVRAFSFDMGRFTILVTLDDETVSEEFSVEPADDHKLVLSELSHASALPGGHVA